MTKTDVVIVGAGVAAVALCRSLLARRPGSSILILEAGGKVPMRDFALYQDYMMQGGPLNFFARVPYQAYYDLPPPAENQIDGDLEMGLAGARLMMYGGTTVHWDGYSFRFKPEDFHLHANTGQGIDWPFGYGELEPWYGEAECFIGVSGDSQDLTVPRTRPYPFAPFPYTLEDQPLIDAFDKLDIGYSHLPIARHGISDTLSRTPPCQTTGTCLYCPFGARYNAANDLDELVEAGQVQVRTRAVVEEVLMASRTRARGVAWTEADTGRRHVAEAGTVVVAAGTVESAKLLLRSTSGGWAQGLGNDHDLVGRNVVTHPWITYKASVPGNPLRLQPEMAFPTLVSRHFDSPEEQAQGKFVLVSPQASTGIDLAALMRQGKTRAEIESAVAGPQQLGINAMFEIFSRPEYRVTNLPARNHLGLQQTRVNLQSTPLIQARLASLKAKAAEILHAAGATGEVSVEAHWGSHHACCTTRMSRSPEQGVVDADLRIHGTDNVHVCSNASFATLSSVNPTLTLAALSLRLGAHLAGCLPGASS